MNHQEGYKALVLDGGVTEIQIRWSGQALLGK